MIEVIIPENCFIIFHYGLVHCGTPSWFISRGEYPSNTRDFFTIVEKGFNLSIEIIVQMGNDFCSMEKCDVYKNNKYGNMECKDPLIDIRLVKKSNAKIN